MTDAKTTEISRPTWISPYPHANAGPKQINEERAEAKVAAEFAEEAEAAEEETTEEVEAEAEAAE